jgi:hypothetical protein
VAKRIAESKAEGRNAPTGVRACEAIKTIRMRWREYAV